jgi:hypothetical protein
VDISSSLEVFGEKNKFFDLIEELNFSGHLYLSLSPTALGNTWLSFFELRWF